jgi:ankyrin repeat protein
MLDPFQSVIYSNELLYIEKTINYSQIEFSNVDSMGPLHFYCFNQNISILEFILKHISKENILNLVSNLNAFHQNVLHVCLFGIIPFISGFELIFKYLIENFDNSVVKRLLLEKDDEGYTPLHGIVQLFHYKSFEMIKKHNLFVNDLNLFEYGLYIVCVKQNVFNFVNFEKSMKIIREIDSQIGNPHKLIGFNKKGTEKFQSYFKKLIIEYFQSNKPDQIFYQTTETYWAIITGKLDYLELLLSKGCDLKYNFEGSFTYLHLALEYRSLKIIEFLLKNCIELLNRKDENGDTVLHISCRKNDLELVKIFLKEESLDLNSKTSWGMTALNIAISRGNKELKELLQSYKCAQSPSIFELMPLELIRRITFFQFDYKSTDDVVDLMQTCKNWNHLISSKETWDDGSKLYQILETHESFWSRHSKWILLNGIVDKKRIHFFSGNPSYLTEKYNKKRMKLNPKSEKKNFHEINSSNAFKFLSNCLYNHLNGDMFIQGFMGMFEISLSGSEHKEQGRFYWDNSFTIAGSILDKICVLDFEGFDFGE